MDVHELCERYRQLYLPAVADALYELGLPEQVLPTYLRPLFPEQRLVGHAFTVEGRGLAPIGWEAGLVRIRSYLEVFERLERDSVLVSVNPNSHVGHFGELTANSAKTMSAGLTAMPPISTGCWHWIISQRPIALSGERSR